MRSINHQAPVQCSQGIVINAELSKVWSVMTNINNWAAWQTDISQPILKGQLSPGASFHWKTGGASIRSTLHTVEPCSQFGWTGKTFGMFAIHNWSLSEVNGQVSVRVDESMEGLLASIFRKSFNKNLEKGMHNWLVLLKKECEQSLAD